MAHRKHLPLDIIWDVLESTALGNSKLLGYILNKLDSETTVFRNLQAPSSALAALGTLQPGAFRFLNPVDSSVSLSIILKHLLEILFLHQIYQVN